MSTSQKPATPFPSLADMLLVYKQINQFSHTNGMELEVPAPGEADYHMTIRAEHLSSPNTCHGGVLAGLMDAALGAAALSLAFTTQELVSTVEFKLNYLHPVHLHDMLVARGRVDHAGNRLIVSSCVIYRVADGQEDVAVARGLGTFNRYPVDKRDFARQLLAS